MVSLLSLSLLLIAPSLSFVAAGSPQPFLDVTDFGAAGDGSDDTTAFQDALNQAAAIGSAVVNVPAGTFTIKGHLIVSANTELRGANNFPYRNYGSAGSGPNVGTTLEAYEGAGTANASDADPFILLSGPNAGLSGMSIVYPEQAGPEADEPVMYPWCIRGIGDDVTVQNLYLVNPYLGIDLGTFPAGRHLVSGIYGNPLKVGIFVDQCYDVGRIRHVHFWNFWAADGEKVVGPLQNWIAEHGVSLQLARTDWEVVEDVFSWGYGRGLVLAQSASGACNGQFTDINFDAVDVGIEVEATQDPGAFFSNLNLANAGSWCNDAAACHQVGIRCTNCTGSVGVVVRGMSLWGDFKQAVQWGGESVFSISDSTLESWDPEFPAMEFTSGRVGVRGVTFGTKDQNVGSVAVAIGEGVDRAIVTGNDFIGATITNNGPRTVVESNLD